MNIYTQYSMLQSLVSPENAVIEAKKHGYDELILCDKNTMSGMVEFYKACKKHNVKPILGTNIKVCEMDSRDKGEYNKMYDLYLVAKNKVGFKNLLKIINLANDKERILITSTGKLARVSLPEIAHLTDGLICLMGEKGTEYAEAVEYEEYTLSKYKNVFHEVVIQVSPNVDCLHRGPKIAWSNVRYLDYEFRQDLLILFCVMFNCLLSDLPDRMRRERPDLLPYLGDRDFSLQNINVRNTYYSKEVIQQTKDFLSSIEEYEILSNPKVPKFDCPDGMEQSEYLTELCRSGWRRRFPKWESKEKMMIYANRVKHELSILQGCRLDGYFLVVQDYINWAKRQGWLVGPGRGSVGGSLVAYLLGITEIDPIRYNLLFERFYSADRNSGETPSLPDVDTDFPREKRHLVIKYLEDRYRKDRVGHIMAVGTLQSRGALKAVLKSHDIFPQSKIDKITKSIPQKDKISDKMEEQKEDCTLRFTLSNYPNILAELATIENDHLVGEYAYYVEQAMRLEGCIRNYSIHASGILISAEPLEEVAPMCIDSDGEEKMVALEMNAAADVSLVKVDMLGLKTLDILDEIKNLLLGISEDQ